MKLANGAIVEVIVSVLPLEYTLLNLAHAKSVSTFNKPQYEDKVLETRKQIESHNPLAFAPKIVRRVTDSPINSIEDNNKLDVDVKDAKMPLVLKKLLEIFISSICLQGD
ncbi:hypothetical protein FRX31_008018 [Thalictrum thalictroides]|uniref:Uncharacterized protein n=1 Tax=Thalictrum thalictroides TaxID=46969 RepID=A0A7J6WY71_THATH|nr:hypothetical protein FRX31_008018 [Thalictrum thalictroides]